MKRKIFISINIPDKIRKRLERAVEKWQSLPVKWTPEANLHVTLVFLGYVAEDDVPGICARVRETAEKSDIFDLEFDRIELFPSAETPRMVALTGSASEELKNLVNGIEESLEISSAPKKTFRPHITLGRGRKYKWEALENKPTISEKFPLTLPVESVEIMASDFGAKGQEYAILESCTLK
ncbi:MAG: RNA 2',3'-cyclic phosphodiesterase [Candidatus Pacebacteria bacterium]|nr:RNA 2',3'-cyclic phosphodiesterase [Candidatus Paceibacterota bacterium]MDR3582812.1 RNA 2',3'-cyclic phosphodiesterase [Candidatus Paceibacterota bacterium]